VLSEKIDLILEIVKGIKKTQDSLKAEIPAQEVPKESKTTAKKTSARAKKKKSEE